MFNLRKQQSGGGTVREHLENVAKITGRVPPELIPPSVDDEALYLLNLYSEIRGTASPSFDGSISVRVGTILMYQTAFRMSLQPWEIDAVIMLDDVYMEVMA